MAVTTSASVTAELGGGGGSDGSLGRGVKGVGAAQGSSANTSGAMGEVAVNS